MLLPLASSVPPNCGDVSATNEAIPLPPLTVVKLNVPLPLVVST